MHANPQFDHGDLTVLREAARSKAECAQEPFIEEGHESLYRLDACGARRAVISCRVDWRAVQESNLTDS